MTPASMAVSRQFMQVESIQTFVESVSALQDFVMGRLPRYGVVQW